MGGQVMSLILKVSSNYTSKRLSPTHSITSRALAPFQTVTVIWSVILLMISYMHPPGYSLLIHLGDSHCLERGESPAGNTAALDC